MAWMAILNFIKLKFFMVYPYLKLHIFFNSNGLAGFSSYYAYWSQKWPQVCHFEFIKFNFFMVYP